MEAPSSLGKDQKEATSTRGPPAVSRSPWMDGEVRVSFADRLGFFFLSRFSQPAADRAVYRLIRQHRLRNIVEVGVGNGLRTGRMIRVAQQASPNAIISYSGIDLFEMRPGGLKLKDAYRTLKATGARVRLIPGEFTSALAMKANDLIGTDLVIISADQNIGNGDAAWFYVPRMLHAASHVLIETADAEKSTFREMNREEIHRAASHHAVYQRAA